MVRTHADNPRKSAFKIAVVIPCYREKGHILDVLAGIGPEISAIYVIDDACPDKTGDFVETSVTDKRVQVLRNPDNLGVGGATLNGYRAALQDGAEIIVKVDGDGQMDPSLIVDLVQPILDGDADYTKGNRLHRRDASRGMPVIRLFGNMGLTLLSKLSSGYWDIMDPTNGFTAIHADVVRELPLDEIAHGFFFESDMLFRLYEINAVVQDVSMRAKYGLRSQPPCRASGLLAVSCRASQEQLAANRRHLLHSRSRHGVCRASAWHGPFFGRQSLRRTPLVAKHSYRNSGDRRHGHSFSHGDHRRRATAVGVHRP